MWRVQGQQIILQKNEKKNPINVLVIEAGILTQIIKFFFISIKHIVTGYFITLRKMGPQDFSISSSSKQMHFSSFA
jgi:hypothetical protein